MSTVQVSLTQSTGRALRWNYIGVFTRMLLGFGINILMARLLGPKTFGELTVAMMVYSFGNLLANVGVGSALIQKQEIMEGDIRFCFTCQMAVGTLMALVLVFSARLWSIFFHEPGITLVLRIVSLLFVFQAFGTTATALLNRNQNSRRVQGISIISYLISYVLLGVPLALSGAGIWSLVLAQLSQALIYSVLAYASIRHSLVPLLQFRYASLLTFGSRILGANICNWGISNFDNAVVGRVAGPFSLGLYNRAFSLAAIPAEGIISSLLQVLLPALSRVQTDKAKLRKIYASMLGVVFMILAPMFAAMAAVPDVVILGLYGQAWAGAVGLFRPLALAIPINAIMALSGPLLASRGRPEREFCMQLIAVAAAIVSYIIAVRWSVLALSWIVLFVYIFRFVLLTQAANREIDGRWIDLMATAVPGLILALAAATVARLIVLSLPPLHDAQRLAIVGGGSASFIVICFATFSRFLLRPIFSRSPQLLTLLPSRLQRLVALTDQRAH
jgi:O-antigen/teichoic acid export membrane protein